MKKMNIKTKNNRYKTYSVAFQYKQPKIRIKDLKLRIVKMHKIKLLTVKFLMLNKKRLKMK